jgi:tRNA (cytidine/uridine-2'-O-)-methyltransferase
MHGKRMTCLFKQRQKSVIEIALFQPDIPQNTGTILRMAACLGVRVHIIEPAGFQWSMKSFRRAGMDYVDLLEIVRHDSYEVFCQKTAKKRMVLATTRAGTAYTGFKFDAGDIILFGRESAGVPENVHNDADERITIVIRPETRSLNIAVSAAMIVGEAQRQIDLNQ